MANPIKWSELGATTTYLTTALDALANQARKIGAEIDNTGATERYTYLMLELYLATQAAPRDAGAYVGVYIIRSVDGTNYEYGDDATAPPSGSWVSNFTLDAVVTARRVALEVPLPPSKFKILVINETGQAFAAANNTLKYRFYSLEVY